MSFTYCLLDHPQGSSLSFPLGRSGSPVSFRGSGRLGREALLGHQRAPSAPEPVMAAARVLLLLSGRPESVSFAQSVCGLLGAGSGLGPWPTHCGLKRGQLVLSDKPFPGASARLPLQVGRGGDAIGRLKDRRKEPGEGGSWRREAWAGHLPRAPPVPCLFCDVNPSGSLPPATAFLPFCGPGPTAQGSGG